MKLRCRTLTGRLQASVLFVKNQRWFLPNRAMKMHGGLALTGLLLAGITFSVPSEAAVKFGTNLGIDFIPQAQVINDYGASGMNCKTLRVGARATEIQPIENQWDWEDFDKQVDEILNSNVGAQILVQVNMGGKLIKPWMRVGGVATANPDPVKFGTFFREVIKHCKQRWGTNTIKFFEAFNEPNLNDNQISGSPEDKADHYVEMLKQAWNLSISARSGTNIKVLGGVVAGAPISLRDSDNRFFARFWNYKSGHQYLDIYSFHLYIRGGDYGGSGYCAPEFTFGDPVRGLLWSDIMVPSVAAINSIKPVWITEMGYDSEDISMGPENNPTVREQNQARWMVRAAIISMGSGLLDRLLHFSAYWDGPAPKQSYGFRHGIGGGIKPQWYAWKTMCDVLNDSVTGVQMKRYFQNTPSGNTTDCLFRYNTTNAKVYGWAMWWVPAGGSGSVTMGGGNIHPQATIEKRLTSFTGVTSWTPITNPGTGSLTVTGVGNAPIYIRVTEP